MARRKEFLVGVVLGSAMMYLFDPESGRHRRAALRHRLARAGDGPGALGGATAAGARPAASAVREQVDDVTLSARVRAELGQLVSNPASIGVVADHGRVTLTGPAYAREVDRLVSGVESIPGVVDVINRLHEQPDDVPGIRGTGG